ncbi:MAG TPA: folylpolyglutamate synthase/dihydrofolate synthase family protein [Gemmatimonadaceae bacterium]|jgi:dihydrofolate synthase/folylpolyglutamate synthase|nr:folylpolyglutamate synthase/dihydrofolate synthase family protein [Gemmatimonadaceae bacterium]
MAALLDAIGRPHLGLRAFHVGGTNGKGSVTVTLAALLRAQGLRVAQYTSPHLVDFRERFLIDGVPITEGDVTDWIERRTPIVQQLGATFFEATTAMGFELFAAADVDVAVIEVGLGGRLDATNVLTPLAAGVASIGIDHTEYLGTTREQIAFEKAGIFKPNRPALIGEPDAGIRELLAHHARATGAAPIRSVADDAPVSDIVIEPTGGTSFTLGGRRLHTGLTGAHQASNTALAVLMLEAAGYSYSADVLPGVTLPGRFQRVGRFIFDVAHNPDGATVLARTLEAIKPRRPVVAVVAVLADKDWRGILTALSASVDHFVLTSAPTAPESRAWRPEDAVTFAHEHQWSADIEHDFARALAKGESAGGTVLVTGSFHTVGDAMTNLQVSPLAG